MADLAGQHGRGILSNVSSFNLGRLVGKLVDANRQLTAAEENLAIYVMNEIIPGTKTASNPDYEHQSEAKPEVKKQKQRAGRRKAA